MTMVGYHKPRATVTSRNDVKKDEQKKANPSGFPTGSPNDRSVSLLVIVINVRRAPSVLAHTAWARACSPMASGGRAHALGYDHGGSTSIAALAVEGYWLHNAHAHGQLLGAGGWGVVRDRSRRDQNAGPPTLLPFRATPGGVLERGVKLERGTEHERGIAINPAGFGAVGGIRVGGAGPRPFDFSAPPRFAPPPGPGGGDRAGVRRRPRHRLRDRGSLAGSSSATSASGGSVTACTSSDDDADEEEEATAAAAAAAAVRKRVVAYIHHHHHHHHHLYHGHPRTSRNPCQPQPPANPGCGHLALGAAPVPAGVQPIGTGARPRQPRMLLAPPNEPKPAANAANAAFSGNPPESRGGPLGPEFARSTGAASPPATPAVLAAPACHGQAPLAVLRAKLAGELLYWDLSPCDVAPELRSRRADLHRLQQRGAADRKAGVECRRDVAALEALVRLKAQISQFEFEAAAGPTTPRVTVPPAHRADLDRPPTAAASAASTRGSPGGPRPAPSPTPTPTHTHTPPAHTHTLSFSHSGTAPAMGLAAARPPSKPPATPGSDRGGPLVMWPPSEFPDARLSAAAAQAPKAQWLAGVTLAYVQDAAQSSPAAAPQAAATPRMATGQVCRSEDGVRHTILGNAGTWMTTGVLGRTVREGGVWAIWALQQGVKQKNALALDHGFNAVRATRHTPHDRTPRKHALALYPRPRLGLVPRRVSLARPVPCSSLSPAHSTRTRARPPGLPHCRRNLPACGNTRVYASRAATKGRPQRSRSAAAAREQPGREAKNGATKPWWCWHQHVARTTLLPQDLWRRTCQSTDLWRRTCQSPADPEEASAPTASEEAR